MLTTLWNAFWPVIVVLIVLALILIACAWHAVDQAITTDPESTSAKDGARDLEATDHSAVTTTLHCTVCGLRFGGKAAWCPDCHAAAIEYRISATAKPVGRVTPCAPSTL